VSDLIAVTGATGQLGSRVARHLAQAGVRQRLVVRDPGRAPDVGGAEIAVASFEDEPSMRAAFGGVRTLFLVSGHEDPHRVELHKNAVRAAAAAGVERVVYTSFMGAAPNATFSYARDHAHTERAILEAGLRLTALRNSLYADVAPYFVSADGVIRAPAGNGRLAWVAREDVARLAATVLVDDSNAGQVYDVSGPEAIDLHETARLLAEATGRDITYHPETLDEARASRAGAEEWQIDGWIGSYLAIATGETSVTSHTVEHLTGRRPWTFAEFLRNEPESWAHLVKS
jgi:NAD(P)H dehydrogenase (quinone)